MQRLCLWLIREGFSTNKLKPLDTLNEWNSFDKDWILERRRLPVAKWRKQPPVWRSKAINGETRCLLLKWYIGKFPVPSSEERGENTESVSGTAERNPG